MLFSFAVDLGLGILTPCHAQWLPRGLHRGANCQPGEEQQGGELNYLEWRLGLRRRDRFERGDLLETLHDQHEDVEVECNYGGDHVGFAPTTVETKAAKRPDRDPQHDQ